MDECKSLAGGRDAELTARKRFQDDKRAAERSMTRRIAAERAARRAAASLGRAMQVDPIKPTSKPPGTKSLKVKYDKLLSNFAFNFNLRRCTWGVTTAGARC